MLPMPNELRQALKGLYPELKDSDLERLDVLMSLRFSLDPVESEEEIGAIDSEIRTLLRKMPDFRTVAQVIDATQTNTEQPTRVHVRFKDSR